MNSFLQRISASLLIIFFSNVCYGQSSGIDSLKLLLETTLEDSTRCEVYYHLLYDLAYDNPTEALEYGKEYLTLAKKVSVREQIAANNQLGITYYNLGAFDKTIEHFTATINLLDPVKDASVMARMLNNLANMYDELEQDEKALEYYYKALNIHHGIGTDSVHMSSIIGNIGEMYLKVSVLDSAYKYLSISYNIDLSGKDTANLLYSMSGLGKYFVKMKKYDSAISYLQSVEEMAILKEGTTTILCQNYSELGDLYIELENFPEAHKYFNKASELAIELESPTYLVKSYEGMAKSLTGLHEEMQAIEVLNKLIHIKDSIFNSETKTQLGSAEIQQKNQEITVLTQRAEIDNLKLQQSRLTTYSLIGVVFLVLLIAVIFYQKHNLKMRALNIVEKQRNEIADKNRDILDSISYAKGIQEAMFPTVKELHHYFPESFVFYKSSDVVTGDFYWVSKVGEEVILAVVDCTGHGVPGAFMTVMANSLLNNIVNERKINSPAEILKELHVSILNTWHENEDSIIYSNGLDAAICKMNFDTLNITYSGAKRPLYHCRDGEIETYKGNCFSVGVAYYHEEISYDEQSIKMKSGDYIYLFTDGIVDQFGGKNNKKFLGKRLKQLIIDMNDKPAKKQQNRLRKEMSAWMADSEQVDDMLLLGVKI